MYKVDFEVKVEVNPTEDPDKVKIAVYKIFGDLNLEAKEEKEVTQLTGKTSSLDGLSRFRDLLRRERIRDAARTVLFKGLHEKRIIFYLNKQVAYVGHVSFSEPEGESPLGAIKVEIKCDDPQGLIDWLAPKTTRHS